MLCWSRNEVPHVELATDEMALLLPHMLLLVVGHMEPEAAVMDEDLPRLVEVPWRWSRIL